MIWRPTPRCLTSVNNFLKTRSGFPHHPWHAQLPLPQGRGNIPASLFALSSILRQSHLHQLIRGTHNSLSLKGEGTFRRRYSVCHQYSGSVIYINLSVARTTPSPSRERAGVRGIAGTKFPLCLTLPKGKENRPSSWYRLTPAQTLPGFSLQA